MNINSMTVEQIAEAMAKQAEVKDGIRPGRFADDGQMASLMDGQPDDPGQAARDEEQASLTTRTDGEDQARDEHGRFSSGGGSGSAKAGGDPMATFNKEMSARQTGRNINIAAFAARNGEKPLSGKVEGAQGNKTNTITVEPHATEPGKFVTTLKDSAGVKMTSSEHASYTDALKAADEHGLSVPVSRPADPKEFHQAFENQMKNSDFKAFVTHYTPDQLAAPDMKCLMSNGGTAGVAVHDHGDGRVEATALWSTGAVKGEGIAMLKDTVANHGVNYVECYAGQLDKMYGKLGFVETSRSPFNKEYASPDWNYKEHGTPDYVTMSLKKPAS